jgi:hypothetical protein
VTFLTDFRIEPRDGGVRLSTETRGYSTDPHARRLFALCWTIIRPGSGLIRRGMLASAARIAEREASEERPSF